MELLVTRMVFAGPNLPDLRPMPLPESRVVERRMPPSAYLDLYLRVGTSVQWDDRLRLSSDELERHLAADATRIFGLEIGGSLHGFCEFTDCDGPSITLANFGVVPGLRGRGFGRRLLATAVRTVWRPGTRIVLETDTNDDSRAIGVYADAGFFMTERFWKTFPD